MTTAYEVPEQNVIEVQSPGAFSVTALDTFTILTKPAAAAYIRKFAWVSDADAGKKLQFSDGSTWQYIALSAL
jgi:hypothetical protein